MTKPNYKLALENAQRSILEDNLNRALSRMTPAQQEKFLSKVMEEVPELKVEAPEVVEPAKVDPTEVPGNFIL